MARVKGFKQNYNSTPQSIREFLDRTADYVKVAPVDQERSIYLISTAKGDGSFRAFAAAAGTSAPSISRILSGLTVNLGHEIIAGFAAAAESSGVMDLDMLMEAQGWVRKDLIGEFRTKEHSIIRQIILDELLSGGYTLEAQTEESEFGFGFDVQLKGSDGVEKLWSFTSLFYPLNKESASAMANAQEWLARTQNNGTADYQSLVIDNEAIFRKIVRNFSKRKTGQQLSVILVSIPQRKVIDEFILSAENGGNMQSVISRQRIYEAVKNKPPKKPYTNNPETIIPQLRWDDCRRIISDAMLRKGYRVQYEERTSIISPFIRIEPDMMVKIRRGEETDDRWVLNIKSFPKTSDNSEALQYIGGWLTKIMAYYYQGGNMSRFSLVLDDRSIYEAVVDMLKPITISGEISLLLISPEKNKILSEFIIPQIIDRSGLIRLV